MGKNQKAEAEFATLQELWANDDRIEEEKMRNAGYKFKITYCVHPISGDAEEHAAFCKTKPDEKQIAALLENSEVKDDYRIKELN